MAKTFETAEATLVYMTECTLAALCSKHTKIVDIHKPVKHVAPRMLLKIWAYSMEQGCAMFCACFANFSQQSLGWKLTVRSGNRSGLWPYGSGVLVRWGRS